MIDLQDKIVHKMDSFPTTTQEYRCSRNIRVHTSPDRCGKLCREVAADLGRDYEPYVDVAMARTVAVCREVRIIYAVFSSCEAQASDSQSEAAKQITDGNDLLLG